ncbi:MAG TPA: histidine kinase [Gemmatimonadales bacterium]|nr:histidine kinase [Gemmatimonadales bacterium]
MARWRTVRAALPAWLLLALFFAALYDGLTPSRALLKGAALATVTGLSLVALWWASGWLPWPTRVTLATYLAHVALALGYGVVWTVLDLAQGSLLAGESRFRFFSLALVLYGSAIYVLAMGVFYAIRAHQRIAAQELAAARLERVATEARLDALRARLNPHFLYNALHALGALVRHDPAGAERAVERLGAILRYVLDRDEAGVTLGTEWRFVEDYLAIEQLRLGDRLRIHADLDVEALECLVPPISVQPLVENAIRHGIAPRVEGGCVGVRASVAGDYLRIVVTDDGPGAASSPATSRGLGLRAVRERAQAWRADGLSGGLEIATAPGRGFTATLTLPA